MYTSVIVLLVFRPPSGILPSKSLVAVVTTSSGGQNGPVSATPPQTVSAESHTWNPGKDEAASKTRVTLCLDRCDKCNASSYIRAPR